MSKVAEFIYGIEIVAFLVVASWVVGGFDANTLTFDQGFLISVIAIMSLALITGIVYLVDHRKGEFDL